jgi:deazaflavin-dependent oxidoreductase (nitroreductase family)
MRRPTLTDRSIPQATTTTTPKLPPRWFIRTAWVVHRAIHRFTGGRRGLARPKGPSGRFGLLRLMTVGRRSGAERSAILGYVEDGANLVTLAMNGWDEKDPAWWLNLRAQPDATVELKGATTRAVHAREAVGEERERLWTLVQRHQGYGDLDGFARRRSQTAVVVLEPRP